MSADMPCRWSYLWKGPGKLETLVAHQVGMSFFPVGRWVELSPWGTHNTPTPQLRVRFFLASEQENDIVMQLPAMMKQGKSEGQKRQVPPQYPGVMVLH